MHFHLIRSVLGENGQKILKISKSRKFLKNLAVFSHSRVQSLRSSTEGTSVINKTSKSSENSKKKIQKFAQNLHVSHDFLRSAVAKWKIKSSKMYKLLIHIMFMIIWPDSFQKFSKLRKKSKF